MHQITDHAMQSFTRNRYCYFTGPLFQEGDLYFTGPFFQERDLYFTGPLFQERDRHFTGPLFQEQLHWTVISRTMVEVTQNDDGLPASQRREKRAESAAEREHTQTMVNGRLDVCPSFVRR